MAGTFYGSQVKLTNVRRIKFDSSRPRADGIRFVAHTLLTGTQAPPNGALAPKFAELDKTNRAINR